MIRFLIDKDGISEWVSAQEALDILTTAQETKSKSNRTITAPDKERFMSYVVKEEGGCWTWNGALRRDGYGAFWWKNLHGSAHRFSMEAYNGINPFGKCVCHSCDNRRCVNPDHLFIGTSADNTHDAIAKGRFAFGERVNTSRLSRKEVFEIVDLCLHGDLSKCDIAKLYGISVSSVYNIERGKTWSFVTKISPKNQQG